MTHPKRNSKGTGSAFEGGPASLESLIETRIARRTLIVGSLASAATQFMSAPAMAVGSGNRQTALIDFEPVPVANGRGPMPSISPDYEYQVLLPWGTPLQPDGPVHTHPPTAANQAQQVGIGHDGMTYFPITDGGSDGNGHGVLALNHEFGRNTHVLGKKSPESADDVRASQHAHGVSVVEIKQIDGRWQPVRSALSRRIHPNTPVAFSGPAAGHPLLQNPAGNAPAGTLANCANGETPWGTYLTCEENFQLYFGSAAGWTPTPEQKRYGLKQDGSRYDWHLFDPRFDLANADFANESNRFGWVVEIDPMDPEHVPVKRTALGRFRHEGAAVVEGRDGRAVVYMGDDARFDYLYKFVSDGDWRDMLRAGRHPLDHGTLFVARFDADGSGRWIELSLDNPDLTRRFRSEAELLTHARIAGDIVGATPMDRPEWTTVAPNGDIYCTLTNNSKRRTPDAANPMAPNADGHIIRW
ncbi:MAG: alkaline phosphatase PhoX, partial [Pseudomonadota bacterium]